MMPFSQSENAEVYLALFCHREEDPRVGLWCIDLANTLALKHDRKRCFIPDHGLFPITDLRNEKKQIIVIASANNFRSYALTITEKTFTSREKNNNTFHSRSQWEKQRMVAMPQSGSAPSAALLTNHPIQEPSSNAPRSGHLKHARSLSNSNF
jgi:hypothetical protein